MGSKKFIAEHVTGLASHDLPASLTREIGRILVKWAYFEHCVQEMNWQTLGLSEAQGRIALREPRVTDRLEMLNDLVKLRNGTWDDALYKSILARARIVAAKRDLLAHGIWGHISYRNEWHVQLARGNWPKNLKDLIQGSRRVTPEGVLIDLAQLRSLTSDILTLIEDLTNLRESAVDTT